MTQKKTRTVSTREGKVKAVEMVKQGIKKGSVPNNAQIFRETGVTRCLNKLSEARVIGEKNGKWAWLTDWTTTEIVDLCWTMNRKEDEQEVTTSSSEVKVIVTQPELPIQNPHIHPHSGLVERVQAALEMCKAYGIQNEAQFIADYLIKTNPVS